MRVSIFAFLLVASGLVPAAPARAGFEVKGEGPGTVTIKQISDDGEIKVHIDGANSSVADDGAITPIVGAPKSVKVQMLPIGGDLEIDIDAPLPGNLDLRLEDTDHINFVGTSNEIGGNLKVKANTNSQLIHLAVNAPLSVGKNVIMDLGAESDALEDNGRDITIGGSVKLTGVVEFDIDATTTVGKNFVWNAKKETNSTLLNDNHTFIVNGSLKFIGGIQQDRLAMNGGNVGAGTSIGKNVSVSLGDNGTGSPQEVWCTEDCTIGGNLKIKSGDSNAGNSLYTDASTEIGKNVNVKYPGPGQSIVWFRGTLLGKSVKYSGSPGTDTITFAMTGNPATFTAKLGDGADALTLDAGADLKSVKIDFGNNTDTFNNPFGPTPPFKLTTKRLP